MIIADSTTLAALTLIGRADLMTQLLGKVTISDGAERELRATLAALDPECAMPGEDVVEMASVDVGAGALAASETETLAAAQQMEAKLLVSDDAVVRAEAQALRLSSVGTLGVLYAAKARGLIEDVAAELAKLRAAGYAASPQCEQSLLTRTQS